jgi:hypothetical protein
MGAQIRKILQKVPSKAHATKTGARSDANEVSREPLEARKSLFLQCKINVFEISAKVVLDQF